MTTTSVYNDVASFIANLGPEKVLELKAGDEMQARLEFLIDKEKNEGLTAQEKDELDQCIVLERLIRLAKAKARY
ncbi:MAG: hypothetical protein GVY26_06810 [Bacteroidetes bacterium]|jgi:hypothetical protein|nr:hypothetical protein [Bacteroidota bacterium]